MKVSPAEQRIDMDHQRCDYIISQARARELFDYNAATGDLIWRRRKVASHGDAVFNGRFPGKVAGIPDAKGYIVIGVRNKTGRMDTLLAHRVVFLYLHGWVPEFIDHINRIPSDNRAENLRPATRAINEANKSLSSRNKSGYRGVSQSRGLWVAFIGVNGRQRNLGRYYCKEKAALAYNKAARKAFGEFATLNKVACDGACEQCDQQL